MPVLENVKHEQFAQLIAKGVKPTKAYTSVGYSRASAASAAARLCLNVSVCARIKELQGTILDATIKLEISNRNARVAELQDRWDFLRAKLRTLLEERGKDMADLPGGSTGLICRDYKGKDADQLITRGDEQM